MLTSTLLRTPSTAVLTSTWLLLCALRTGRRWQAIIGGVFLALGALGLPLADRLDPQSAALVGFAFSFSSTVFAAKMLEAQGAEFKEILPIFEDYVPDAKPATVSVQTRAIADMCLLLFNSNEFVYVY